MMKKVYVTRPVPDSGPKMLLDAGFDARVSDEDRVLTRDEIIANIRDCEGVFCLLTDKFDGAVMDCAPKLRIIGQMAVGYDNIDVAAATARGIAVSNTPGVLTDATADLAWALLMSASRRVVEGDRWMRSGTWAGWGPMQLLGGDLAGRTLGIVGAGRIGYAVARRSRGWDMKVLYHDPIARPEMESELGARKVGIEELLRESDYISLHCPLIPETRHFIGKAQLEMMKPTAYLINTSRGPVIDEAALAEALMNKRIAGAGLDVYENEPKVNPVLMKLDNVVLLPHLGSASTGTRQKMSAMTAENIIAALEGRTPPNCVNLHVLKGK
ncbi:MAG TPA: D-glycerate dehydrogenase [Candidatus Brocadiia bacterium]|nr:D-glycerate dehydrogenase [Candidatus Brocadiia bacterium]